MKLSICAATITTIAMCLAFAIPASMAQGADGNSTQSNPGYSGAPGTANQKTIDDATLNQTARAFVKVRAITQREQSVLNNTSDGTAKQKVAQQTESKKVAAVKAEGLQPQQYNQVLELVQNDNGMRQKFLSYVNRAQNSQKNAM